MPTLQEVKALLKRGVLTIPQLREMLKDEDSGTRRRAVFIIRTGKVKDTIPELTVMLNDKDDDVLISVLQTLVEFNTLNDAVQQFIGFQRFEGFSEKQIGYQLKRIHDFFS